VMQLIFGDHVEGDAAVSRVTQCHSLVPELPEAEPLIPFRYSLYLVKRRYYHAWGNEPDRWTFEEPNAVF